MKSRPLPSEHEAARIAQAVSEATAREAVQRHARRVRAAFDWLLKQENGRLVWAELFRVCGWNKVSLTYFAAGDVAPLKTECKEAQRAVYAQLRGLVTPEILARAEFEAEFGVSEEPKKGESKNG